MLTIKGSINAILHSEESFGEKFYSMMFTGYPELQQYFSRVNMREQAVAVTMALTLIENYYSQPNLATRNYLKVLGNRHCQWQIPKGTYVDWSETLLDTLSAFHEHAWNESLAEQWKEAIETATQVMFEGYDKRPQI